MTERKYLPLITILMPIYNGIEFIAESVNSIKQQTFENWELIIGINGHPKNSDVCKIAKTYESYNIKVFDMDTIKGKSNALNEMLQYARSDWIALLDVDDMWLPNKLKYQIPNMNNYDVIGTQCQYFGDASGNPSIPYGDITDHDFLKLNPIINSSCLLKKKFCFWDNSTQLEDYDLWIRLWKEGKTFFNIEQVHVRHRIHETSAFNGKVGTDSLELLKQKYV